MTKLNLTVHVSDPAVRAEIVPLSSKDGVDVFRLNVVFPEKNVPSPVTVAWSEEIVDYLHVWYPTCKGSHSLNQWFGPRQCDSVFNCGSPILTAIGADNRNTVTVSVSDTFTPIAILLGCNNKNLGENLAEYQVQFFTRPCTSVETYTADIRIDRRHVPFCDAVMSVYPWWKEYGHVIPDCLPDAEDPLYSTWYNYTHALSADTLLADLKIASKLGFKNVILDDGWQFDGLDGNGYSTCGDWLVAKSKFPDFKAFTDEVHALGMKLLVWFSLAHAGWDTEFYKKCSGKILSMENHLSCATVDPRYPEVRLHIVDAHKRFLEEYDVDGFKLDFVGSFQPEGDTAPYNPETMDCEAVEEGVKKLLTSLTTELSEMKPGLLFEHRQNYTGPEITRFCNMLRVGDCAYHGLTNRLGMVNLRLMGYPTAIHADMLCWSPMEDAKLCAKQLLNTLFCVPQISVILGDCGEDQRQVIRHYLSYWTENRDILLHGRFYAENPEYHYPYVSAEGEEKLIAAIYADTSFTYTGKACDVHLNGSRDGLVFENPTDKVLSGEIYDCFGTLLETVDIGAGTIVRLPVPETGMLRIG